MTTVDVISAEDGSFLGRFEFHSLPRIGEQLRLAIDPKADHHLVENVEHWPREAGTLGDVGGPSTIIVARPICD